MNYFKVFTQRMCSRLMSEGFKLQGIAPDAKFEGYNMFLFEDTERLRQRVKEIQEEFKHGKQ